MSLLDGGCEYVANNGSVGDSKCQYWQGNGEIYILLQSNRMTKTNNKRTSKPMRTKATKNTKKHKMSRPLQIPSLKGQHPTSPFEARERTFSFTLPRRSRLSLCSNTWKSVRQGCAWGLHWEFCLLVGCLVLLSGDWCRWLLASHQPYGCG